MSQSEDMTAIADYFSRTVAVTPQAVNLKDDWTRWWNGLSWFSRTLDGDTYDLARNKRNAFNLANAITPQAKADAERVIKEGLTTEQSEGEPDRRDSSGNFPTPSAPLIPKALLIGGAVVIGLSIIAAASQTPAALAKSFRH